jgi:hypothetical protein
LPGVNERREKMQLVTNVLSEDEEDFRKFFLAAVPLPKDSKMTEDAWIASYGPKAYNAAVKKGEALLMSQSLAKKKGLAY